MPCSDDTVGIVAAVKDVVTVWEMTTTWDMVAVFMMKTAQ